MRFLLLALGSAVAVVALWAQSQSVSNSMGMEFVQVPAGQFQMGCSSSDKSCGADEKPAHMVKITKPFYLGKFEVTQGQWQALMGGNPSYFNEKTVGAKWMNYPVEQVSWNAVPRNSWKSSMPRSRARSIVLPTEAEWEYAARAGTTDSYQGAAADRAGWSWSNSGGTTHEVGQLKPNAWGIYDMLGNVWEWVDDGYDEKYYKTSPDTDPQGPEQDDFASFSAPSARPRFRAASAAQGHASRHSREFLVLEGGRNARVLALILQAGLRRLRRRLPSGDGGSVAPAAFARAALLR